MTRYIALAASAWLSLAGAPASAQDSFEVVRLGDGQMTCEALAGEMNGLNQVIRQQASDTQRNAQARRFGRGLLSGLAQGATMMSGMGAFTGSSNPLTGMVASAAVSGVASELAAGATSTPAAPESAPENTPQRQRLAHLNDMFVSRGC